MYDGVSVMLSQLLTRRANVCVRGRYHQTQQGVCVYVRRRVSDIVTAIKMLRKWVCAIMKINKTWGPLTVLLVITFVWKKHSSRNI